MNERKCDCCGGPINETAFQLYPAPDKAFVVCSFTCRSNIYSKNCPQGERSKDGVDKT